MEDKDILEEAGGPLGSGGDRGRHCAGQDPGAAVAPEIEQRGARAEEIAGDRAERGAEVISESRKGGGELRLHGRLWPVL